MRAAGIETQNLRSFRTKHLKQSCLGTAFPRERSKCSEQYEQTGKGYDASRRVHCNRYLAK